MTWNYRVIKRYIGDEESYGIHEVYYDDNGYLDAYSENPIAPHGNSFNELIEDFEHYSRALKEPVLSEKDFKK